MVVLDSQYKFQAWQRNDWLCAMLVVLCVIFTSCDGTADSEEEKSLSRIEVDWSSYGKSVPAGMTVLFQHIEPGDMVQAIDNDVTGITSRLSPGRHWATVFNLTEQEFVNIGFRGLDAVETAKAYVKESATSKWYDGVAGSGNYVAGQPEWLAVDTIMTTAIEPVADGVKIIGTLHPKNIIYTLHVTVHVDNMGNLLAARGAISGLAAGRRFAADFPEDNAVTVTHLIEADDWICSRSSSPQGDGLVKADVRCFGLPANHNGTPEENRLEIQALLADGKTVKRYDIPVGHLIKEPVHAAAGRGDNLDLYLELRLDPALPPYSGNGGGVDVWFNDWDERIDFNMPI